MNDQFLILVTLLFYNQLFQFNLNLHVGVCIIDKSVFQRKRVSNVCMTSICIYRYIFFWIAVYFVFSFTNQIKWHEKWSERSYRHTTIECAVWVSVYWKISFENQCRQCRKNRHGFSLNHSVLAKCFKSTFSFRK